MAAPMISMRLTGVNFQRLKLFSFKMILELENNGQFLHAKTIQSLNDAIFKNYLQEARWGFPMR